MEKYKRFTDAASGVNPFVPATAASPPSSLGYLLFGIIFGFLLRLPLLLAAVLVRLCLAAAFVGPATLLGLSAPAHRAVNLVFDRTTALFRWTILAPLIGIGELSTVVCGMVKRRPALQPGDIVAATFTSYADPLVLHDQLAYRGGSVTSAAGGEARAAGCGLVFGFPVYTDPTTDTSPTGLVLCTSLFSAVMQAAASASPQAAPSGSAVVSLAEALQGARRLEAALVLFPESTTTNGKGLLRFVTPSGPCKGGSRTLNCNVYVAMIHHRMGKGSLGNPRAFCTPGQGSVGTWEILKHVLWCGAEQSSSATVLLTSSPVVSTVMLCESTGTLADHAAATIEQEGRKRAAEMGRAPLLQQGVKNKTEFLEYFWDKQ